MSGSHDYLRLLAGQAAAEEAFLDRLGRTREPEQGEGVTGHAPPPAVSLMITNRQRAELRERGFSDEAIRQMTPAQAHAHLGIAKPAS